MIPMKGRPKRRKGCLERRARYALPIRWPRVEEDVVEGRKGLDEKTGIVAIAVL